MGIPSSKIVTVSQKKQGYPYSNNPYWKMARQGRIGNLNKQFQNGNVDCFQIIEQSSGHTLLHQSITLNRRQLFKLCEIYGTDWNKKDVNGVTPLMKAVALNRTYFVDKLMELGVSIQEIDNRGKMACDYAQLHGNEYLNQQLTDVNQE